MKQIFTHHPPNVGHHRIKTHMWPPLVKDSCLASPLIFFSWAVDFYQPAFVLPFNFVFFLLSILSLYFNFCSHLWRTKESFEIPHSLFSFDFLYIPSFGEVLLFLFRVPGSPAVAQQIKLLLLFFLHSVHLLRIFATPGKVQN